MSYQKSGENGKTTINNIVKNTFSVSATFTLSPALGHFYDRIIYIINNTSGGPEFNIYNIIVYNLIGHWPI
jgi:hypothetical protein